MFKYLYIVQNNNVKLCKMQIKNLIKSIANKKLEDQNKIEGRLG